MFFTLKELLQWFGMTVFEMWISLSSILVFTILLALRFEGLLQVSWWAIFSPLLISDTLNAYFCVIVFIRMYLDGTYKSAILRAMWSFSLIGSLFMFKFLLCKKLEGSLTLEHSEVMTPVFILLKFIIIRACQLQ